LRRAFLKYNFYFMEHFYGTPVTYIYINPLPIPYNTEKG
jgi:hypothetical protein